MKSLALAAAALFGTTAGALLPYVGPVHAEKTQPFSLYGQFASSTATLTLGAPPRNFVVTEVLVGAAVAPQTYWSNMYLTVNGARVLNLAGSYNAGNGTTNPTRHQQLTTGVEVPAGATVGFETEGSGNQSGLPVTVLGYLHP